VDAKTSFMEFIRENIVLVMAAITGVLLVIIFLLVIYIRAQKKASKEQHMVENLNKQVYVDALTHVRNKGGFDKYIDSLKNKISNGEIKDVAVGMLDCNNLKTINDRYGHEKGDVYLKAATKLICSIFQHSPVFRIGGDEFSVILQNEDFSNREWLTDFFERERAQINEEAYNPWEEVHITLGMSVYDGDTDRAVIDVVRRADKDMYEHKRNKKMARG
jgi:diguanylate cyclase (GGDEF)-like protein